MQAKKMILDAIVSSKMRNISSLVAVLMVMFQHLGFPCTVGVQGWWLLVLGYSVFMQFIYIVDAAYDIMAKEFHRRR